MVYKFGIGIIGKKILEVEFGFKINRVETQTGWGDGVGLLLIAKLGNRGNRGKKRGKAGISGV